MSLYYVNKNSQSNGDHEVHKKGCSFFPHKNNAEYLGNFSTCHYAVSKAKRRDYKANGCYYCSKECHTG